jgi:hypothetical protein
MNNPETGVPTVDRPDDISEVEELIQTTAESAPQGTEQAELEKIRNEPVREYIQDTLDRATKLRDLREQLLVVAQEQREKRGGNEEIDAPLKDAMRGIDLAMRALVKKAKSTSAGYQDRIEGVVFEDWQDDLLRGIE